MTTANSGTLQGVELVMWNTPAAKEAEFRPTIEQTRVRLEENGLPSKYAEDIADTTAFRRACDQCRAPNIEARCFKGADGELYVQIDELIGDVDDTSAKLRREIKGVWKHTPSGPKRVRGYDYQTHELITLEYNTAKTTYEYADIGRILQQILVKEGLGIYSPRKAGGVYFAPTDATCADLLDRVELFCQSLNVRLLRYAVPDTETQIREIGEAIAAGIAVDVAQHREAVESYTITTRPETLQNRRALMGQTKLLLVRLNQYLNGHALEFGAQLDQLEEQIQALEAQAAAAVPVGRRVLVTK